MLLRLERNEHNENITKGTLYIDEWGYLKPLCRVLEDVPRKKKIFSKTRIPAGRYEIAPRRVGRIYKKYLDRFTDIPIRVGMPHLRGVPNFRHILIHCGNTKDDTAGCLLVGEKFVGDTIVNSGKTFKRIYCHFYDAWNAGEKIFIEIVDENTILVESLFTKIIKFFGGFFNEVRV